MDSSIGSKKQIQTKVNQVNNKQVNIRRTVPSLKKTNSLFESQTSVSKCLRSYKSPPQLTLGDCSFGENHDSFNEFMSEIQTASVVFQKNQQKDNGKNSRQHIKKLDQSYCPTCLNKTDISSSFFAESIKYKLEKVMEEIDQYQFNVIVLKQYLFDYIKMQLNQISQDFSKRCQQFMGHILKQSQKQFMKRLDKINQNKNAEWTIRELEINNKNQREIRKYQQESQNMQQVIIDLQLQNKQLKKALLSQKNISKNHKQDLTPLKRKGPRKEKSPKKHFGPSEQDNLRMKNLKKKIQSLKSILSL